MAFPNISVFYVENSVKYVAVSQKQSQIHISDTVGKYMIALSVVNPPSLMQNILSKGN